jgi:hypothetical protein
MLTWAMVELVSRAKQVPGVLFLLAMGGDVLIVFLLACAARGWPGSSNAGRLAGKE